MKRVLILTAGLLICGSILLLCQIKPAVGQDQTQYVGSQVCSGCHKAIHDQWLLTPHRQTLAAGRDQSLSGCEACHGPGGPHVAGGGDPSKIIRPSLLDAKAVNDICLKCHRQYDVLLFRTSSHSAAKIRCNDCHDVHQPGEPTMLRNLTARQYSIRGLVVEIENARRLVGIASTSDERTAALAKLDLLEKKKADLQKSLDSPETRARRATEQELCYACHKEIQTQFRLPTHHPVTENRLECSSCHNPHGGPNDNLRGETINQTCYKCHAEKAGPYVFEHPPVEEDCTLCHRPHGSAQNFLLKQSEPFLCLKCHAGPHSRGGTLQNGSDAATTSRVPYYYWQCTSCHNRPHGSDRHAAFHY